MSETAPASVSTGNASDLIATLRHRAPRVALAVAAGQMAWPAAKHLRDKARERSTYTVKITALDAIYDDLHEWVLGLLPPGDQRALVAWTTNRDNMMPTPEGVRSAPPRLRLRYDGSREQTVTIAGHRIKVVVSDGEAAAGDSKWRKPAEILFTATSVEAQRHLLDEISQVAQASHETKRQPVFRMLDQWGDWRRLDDLPDRALDSVILAQGQLERLIDDVSDFLNAESDYVRRCTPWHRGHLYEGPPGTGKTSVARAIASHFKMDIWYLPLADIQKDTNLLSVVNRISPRSMLLLEDADVFHAATQRDEGDSGVTLSGLLNALDGIATPHGLLTVLTTNTPDLLDAAVVRPGRVDLIEHLGFADRDQVSRLLSRWYGKRISVPGVGTWRKAVSPAQVVEACKRHDDDAAAALGDILDLQRDAARRP